MGVSAMPADPNITAGSSTRRLVVVGVDSSKASSAALIWAAEEARMRQAALKVVHVWQVPTVAYGGYLAPPVITGDWQPAVIASLRDQVRSVLGDHRDLEVDCEVKEGPPAQVLLEQAKEADLLVVGSRGHGGFVGLLLGSVSSHVVHHAACPVTIVPEKT